MDANGYSDGPAALQVIAACLGRRFSGINASMIAVMPDLSRHIRIAAMGFHIPDGIPRIRFLEFLRHCRSGPWRIWHARRNIDMLGGLLLRYFLRYKLVLVFTSAAQRHHSWITRFFYRRMDGVIATTAKAASYLTREAVVVRHGVNTVAFSPPDDRAAAWARRGLPGRYGIGVLGRIRPRKGTEEFIRAMIRVLPERPEWTAVVVGQTTEEFRPFEQRLRGLLREAGLSHRVHFTGFLKDPAEIPEWYRSLWVVVCPSRVEGFGLTCLEAMASGCPVVATSTGAWPEVITEGRDGYVVPCRDVDAMTEAILRITEDPQRILEMGERARGKIASQYRIGDEACGILAEYRRLLATYEEKP
jgi:glycosyltransferase involved in cell wall biosynthesis